MVRCETVEARCETVRLKRYVAKLCWINGAIGTVPYGVIRLGGYRAVRYDAMHILRCGDTVW